MGRRVRNDQKKEGVSTRSAGDLARFGVNAALVEEIRERYDVDPSSVDPDWAALFEQQAKSQESSPATVTDQSNSLGPRVAAKHAKVLRLIHSYRARGHRVAGTDPLGSRTAYFPELDPAHYGFGDAELDRVFIAGDLPGGPEQTLREILERLRATYCRTIGAEFTHIQDPGRKAWLMQRMEKNQNSPSFDAATRLAILEKLSAAELFERFLHTRFLGQKRFSLEGAESVIPALDVIAEDAPSHGIRELVLGMAHRGRLNVLSNILGKSLESIFSEFEDAPLLESPFGSGDVKYHKGFSSDRITRSGDRVHLSLTSNPSHLEAVDPVVEGRVRAKQVRNGDLRGDTVLPVLVHGEAAFAGQGVVAETLNLARLKGYSTGGTIHLVINNQIGFTTMADESRSTLYSTDVAKMIQIPIFHVNGDDPESVVHCVKIAMEYRQRFHEGAVIEIVCYRKHGHNEGDEPRFTQPLLYEKIHNHQSTRLRYTEQLIQQGLLRKEDTDRIEEDLNSQLSQALQAIKTKPPGPDEPYDPRGPWTGFSRVRPEEDVDTKVSIERLTQIAEGLARVPQEFALHPKLRVLMDKRHKVVAEDGAIDWSLGEALAFGSLLVEGTPVRLSGQDCGRGTFSQRHAIVVDQKTGQEFAPLDHLSTTQARFEVYDSPLSEAAVLGFEYGFSLADPTTLTLWEAQFGDFANGAQVIIDQFISSAHVKWQRMSGLVMLLPHGYEGQGPEHSSARIERFLQLCAEESMQVANCTTPAQYFHLLRRQMRREYRSPLVIFTPKSLLRLPRATSQPVDLAEGMFYRVIDDVEAREHPNDVNRVLICSGKVYYDLLEETERRKQNGDAGNVAIIRIEEIYPWPANELAEIVRQYVNAEKVIWVQEEPANMGAWTFVRERLTDVLRPQQRIGYAGRPEQASPAVGSLRVHRQEQELFLSVAFAGLGAS